MVSEKMATKSPQHRSSAASDLAFDFDRPDRSSSQLAMYRRALPQAGLIVAQREEQLELARGAGYGPATVIRSTALPLTPLPLSTAALMPPAAVAGPAL